MTKRTRKPRKPRKRGPKEERLTISDPVASLDTLLKKKRVPLSTIFGYDADLPKKPIK